MDGTRKRRRQTCSKCGRHFASSWINQHRASCGRSSSIDCSTNTEEDAMINTTNEGRDVMNNDFIDQVGTDLHDISTEAITCTGITISDELADQLQDRFDMKRFEEEDSEFFEEINLENEIDCLSEDQPQLPSEPLVESWSVSENLGEIEEDFCVNDSTEGPRNCQSEIPCEESVHIHYAKVEVLVLWLMLFLSSWQSKYAVTDTALTMLIKFLCRFFWLLGVFDNTMASAARLFPNSHYKLKKALGMLNDDFFKYVVCPKCKSLYTYDDCVEVRCGRKVSSRCKFVAWPNHPHRSKRGPCGEYLLKSVRGRDKTVLYPRMVFPYKSLISSLQMLLKRPGFWENCQLWRNKEAPPNIMSDIHHGNVWKELSSDGFLSNLNSLALALNVDWFQPHKHSPGSVGVLYMVVLNLPREERYKLENVIVVGILPGPTEPKLTANTFLTPLVDELKVLWTGKKKFSICNYVFQQPIKVGLICVTCDIPASRKIGGFMGHMANQGCSRCKKSFFKEGGLDFSGFDRESWPPRNSDEHKKHGRESLEETSPSSQQAKCSHHGARYSVLHELEYFDCIRYFVIDPMHNLYLGTAKHMMKNVWQNEASPMFKDEDFKKMQRLVDSMVVPQDIGRIPHKIACSFNGFTADQWQNWTMIYSVYALTEVMKREHLECWALFVNACKQLGKKVLSIENIEKGDEYLMRFLKNVEEMYGPASVTPNMHLHGHLKQCLLDFGPFHGFWCFSFERYNGILGRYHTNNRSIEIQLMRKFLSDVKAREHELPSMYKDDFIDFFKDQQTKGSLKTTLDPICNTFAFRRHQSISINELSLVKWDDFTYLQTLSPIKDFTLDADDIRYLKVMYSKLIGIQNIDILDIPYTVGQYSSVQIGSIVYGSLNSRTIRNSYVLAKWAGVGGRISDNSKRPGEVVHYFRQRVKVRSQDQSCPDQQYTFHLARVNWYSTHPDQSAFGDCLQLWCRTFDSFGPACFIPVQRIISRFVLAEGEYNRDKVMVVSTLPGEE